MWRHCKKHKHKEAKFVTKQPMNHWRNERGNKKYKNEYNIIQNLWDTAKAFLSRKQSRINGHILRLSLPRLNKKEIENINRWITSTEIETVI